MLPDRESNPGPLIYESGALPIALHGRAPVICAPATLGPGKCWGLRGLCTVTLSGSCVVLVVSSAVVVRDF